MMIELPPTFAESMIELAPAPFLEACSARYEQLTAQLHDLTCFAHPEAILTWVEMIAGFAATNHPGRFVDGTIENIALKIGQELSLSTAPAPPAPLTKPSISSKRSSHRVVHVATVATSIGGHTRTIINWIRKDHESQHSLLLTRQGSTPLPKELVNAIVDSGGGIVVFSETDRIITRASWLRILAPRYGDIAVLHLVPDDVVPIVAFATETPIPIGLVNLADQCFWLGCTVADSTVNLRKVSRSINASFRFTRNELDLPIPLCEKIPPLTKREARAKLGIPNSHFVLLTVGRAIKYAPSRRQSFFRTAANLLSRHPQAQLFVMGVSAADYCHSENFVRHDRMHFLGPLPDATDYQRAADLYLEGFPFGSQTALLESVLPGTACVRAVAPLSPVLAASDVAIDGIAPVPCDESEYIALADLYISDCAKRNEVAMRLRDGVLRYHVNDQWNSMLNDAYAQLGQLRHAAQTIPTTRAAARSVDLAISEYHGTRFIGIDPLQAVDSLVRNSIFGSAYTLRQRGAYRDSWNVLRMSNSGRWWRDRRSVAFAVKLIPHKLIST